MARVIAARLGILRPPETGRSNINYNDFRDALARQLNIKEATRSAMSRLESSRLIEYAKLRRIVEESLDIIQVVSLIRESLGKPEAITWGEVENKKVLPDYAGEREIQQIAEDLLASEEFVWANDEEVKKEFKVKLAKYFSLNEIDEINKRLEELNKNIAWAELREMLRGFASEDEVRTIAMGLVSGFAFPWQKWEWSLKQRLTVASLMNKITGKLTSLTALADHSSTGRKAFAVEVVNYANRNEMLSRLEGQMRFINPEALYYI